MVSRAWRIQDSVLVHKAISDRHSHFRVTGQARGQRDMAEEASSVARKKLQLQTLQHQNKEKFFSFVDKLYRAALSRLLSSRRILSAGRQLRLCKEARRQQQAKVASSVDPIVVSLRKHKLR